MWPVTAKKQPSLVLSDTAPQKNDIGVSAHQSHCPLSALVFLQSIMKIPDLVDHLKGLSDQGMALGPLLALLLPPLGNCIFDKKLYLKTALQLVKRLPLGEPQLLPCSLHTAWLLFPCSPHLSSVCTQQPSIVDVSTCLYWSRCCKSVEAVYTMFLLMPPLLKPILLHRHACTAVCHHLAQQAASSHC